MALEQEKFIKSFPPKEPLRLDVDLINKGSVTVGELLTSVREEANKVGLLNDKHECILGENPVGEVDETVQVVRVALAMTFMSEDGRIAFIARNSIAENSLANKSTRKGDIANYKGADFIDASRGIFPDSSFKVGNVIDDAEIINMKFVGNAIEEPDAMNAKGDALYCLMPSYVATISNNNFNKLLGKDNVLVTTLDRLPKLTADKHPSPKIQQLRREYMSNNTSDLPKRSFFRRHVLDRFNDNIQR